MSGIGVGEGLTIKKQRGIFWPDGNILWYVLGGVYMTVYVCQNSLNYISKRLNLTLCKLHLNKSES